MFLLFHKCLLQPKFPNLGRITRDCQNLYINEIHKLKSMFSHSQQGLSVTTDRWSSVPKLSYLCFIAHFIDDN